MSKTPLPMTPESKDAFKNDIDGPRRIKARNCLNSACHQNETANENSNTLEVLILVMDALGYSAEEILCHKQFSFFNDKLDKIFTLGREIILTGSVSQGFTNSLYSVSHLSDFDYTTINTTIKVVTDQEYFQYKQNPNLFFIKNAMYTVLRAEDDPEFPGYVKLNYVMPKATAEGHVCPSRMQYFSSRELRHRQLGTIPKPVHQIWEGTNGPAITTLNFYSYSGGPRKIKEDFVQCLDYKTWPDVLHNWTERSRPNDLPSTDIIQKITQEGCYLVPVGHFDSESEDLQWRLSVYGEKLLFSELKPVQYYCFVALRLILKGDISLIDEDVLTSFHMKNVVYWCAEQSSCAWTIDNFENCLQTCIQILIKFVSSGTFPNYFTVGRNLLNSKMTSELSKNILKLLKKYSDNIYEILNLNSLSSLKSATLYKRTALKLAVQKSVIYASVKAYSQTVSIVADSHYTIFTKVSTSLDLLECLQTANQINHALKSEKQHYLRRHILRSYIHSILAFLNYACFKTLGQNEYLSTARKHLSISP